MRYRKEKFSIDSGRAKGRPDPDWFLDFPELLPGEEVYMRAFWTLGTERFSAAGTLGAIPWSKAVKYATEWLGFQGLTVRSFWTVISTMDAAFLDFKRAEYNKARGAA